MRARFALVLLAGALFGAGKRPLTHADYDAWRHIQDQKLSNDGRYLAYALFPQQGNGELVVRDLASGKELRQPIGELPPPPPPNFTNPQPEDEPPPAIGIALKFSADSRTLVCTTFPAHGVPAGDIVILNLVSGVVFRTPQVKSFQIGVASSGYVAYLQNSGDLILRNLAGGAERKFPKVSEYTITRDGKLLVYSQDANGIFAIRLNENSAPITLLPGKGKYDKLAWDEDQIHLAFLKDHDLCSWDRSSQQAAVVHNITLPDGWIVSDKAILLLSKGGRQIFFGTAPKPAPPAQRDGQVSVDLWSWKDDHIQPMQKVRAEVERSRSYRAVYDVSAKRFLQLADRSMNEISPSDDGAYAIGTDDRAYRRMQEYETSYEDSYLVNTANGQRKLVAAKHPGHLTWSSDSRHAIFFDGKDWIAISAPAGDAVNLTAKLGVKFGREDYDAAGQPTAYGLAGWTRDGRYVLFYDRYDIWRCQPGAGSCENLTQGYGRKEHIVFRLLRLERDDPAARWIDSSEPLLLRAENDDTHDSGFFRASWAGGAPEKLVMQAKNLTPPAKARDADVYLTTASTFRDYPDLLVTDHSFRELRKVSDVDPQLAGLSWGSARMIHYSNADGVPLQAILYTPENFDPSKKYPLLVYIYERLSQGINNFIEPRPQHSINVSYYVSNGYLVLEPDIAYRVGYPGQSALNCVLPAIQAVINKGGVDEKAIGIQGHSWGGYQIAYMVTRTNRFRAAAAGAPVADMISAYDGIRWGPGLPRQFQYERTQSRIGGSLWEYPLRYIENSPVFLTDRITTPLLLLHNDTDDAVPWTQGIEFYLALRRLN
ncbi:MAG TPA: prolyl oligopeptidase family serine peptidase, partial [Bryobacteraceae bacterium]|nr:prolyl oligopeptidase family serine peptidase [Bryobacteraceae bacterium]